jgi:hypothetical protein
MKPCHIEKKINDWTVSIRAGGQELTVEVHRPEYILRTRLFTHAMPAEWILKTCHGTDDLTLRFHKTDTLVHVTVDGADFASLI